MNSREILQNLETWALSKDFSAPYGVLTGEHTFKRGTKYLSITFGRARTLDATIEVYNRNFFVARTNRHGSSVFKNLNDLMTFVNTL